MLFLKKEEFPGNGNLRKVGFLAPTTEYKPQHPERRVGGHDDKQQNKK